VFALFGVASCSDDNKVEDTDKAIIGKWELVALIANTGSVNGYPTHAETECQPTGYLEFSDSTIVWYDYETEKYHDLEVRKYWFSVDDLISVDSYYKNMVSCVLHIEVDDGILAIAIPQPQGMLWTDNYCFFETNDSMILYPICACLMPESSRKYRRIK
jgi:hypothetical protein